MGCCELAWVEVVHAKDAKLNPQRTLRKECIFCGLHFFLCALCVKLNFMDCTILKPRNVQ